MATLKNVIQRITSADRLAAAGVPSATIAFLDEPTAPIDAVVLGSGNENAETIYQACSISKPVTALAVARLIDEGKLTYETKVVDILNRNLWKGIIGPETEHLMHHVNVGHLLSHRSGLSGQHYEGYSGQLPTYDQSIAGVSPSNTPRIRFLHFPGSQVSYSGGGFTLLQILLEQLLGTPFAEILHNTVLQPLKMTRSHFGPLPPDENNFAKAHSTGYLQRPQQYHDFTELAAAGLWTTPSDLVKAVSAIQRSLHSPNGFLTQQTAREMLSLNLPNASSGFQMSYGWGVDPTFFAHSGWNDPGYFSYVIAGHGLSSSSQSGNMTSLAIMVNSSAGMATMNKLVAAICHAKSWSLYDTLPGGFGRMTTIVPYAAPENVPVHALLKEYTGKWIRRTAVDQSSEGVAEKQLEAEYEILDIDDSPYIRCQGVENLHRLRLGCIPGKRIEAEVEEPAFVVDGLEMAFRLTCDANSKRQQIDLIIGGDIVVLQRLGHT